MVNKIEQGLVKDNYYEATTPVGEPTRYTNVSTPGPVFQGKPFYQEKQKGGRCGIHSMGAFRGGPLEDHEQLIALNNKVQKEAALAMGIVDPNLMGQLNNVD